MAGNQGKQAHDGGCLCGAIRYRLKSDPEWSGNCHCPSCVKATGGAFSTWVGVKKENFEVIKGGIKICETSPGVERGFCGNCGSSLTCVIEKGWPGQVSVTASTLDDPSLAKPTVDIWVSTKMPWVKLDEALKSFPEF
ncbi:MAG TPA: GFA family protein [Thermohalobaculum sp.]|nr:GFA family protein [Thermohalobaculum sp.]